MERELGLSVEAVHRTPKPTPEKTAKGSGQRNGPRLSRRGIEVLPRRWAVERTFARLGQNQRVSKDHERLCSTSESFVFAAMTRLMV